METGRPVAYSVISYEWSMEKKTPSCLSQIIIIKHLYGGEASSSFESLCSRPVAGLQAVVGVNGAPWKLQSSVLPFQCLCHITMMI